MKGGAMKDYRVIQQGIELAEQELASIKSHLEEMKPLMQRQEALEAFVIHARALLPQESIAVAQDEGGLIAEEAKAEEETVSVDGKAVWTGAAHVLGQARRPLRVAEITNEMIRKGWQLSDRWATEVVRAAMGRKVDVFERVGPGLFALRSWPAHMKAITRRS